MLAALGAAAAVLLVVSGVAKLYRPTPAARMIATLLGGRPASGRVALARTVGLIEVAVGALVLGLGGRFPAALLAACYLAFAIVALRLLTLARSGGTRVSCGCFGRDDTPAGWPHVVLNVVALAVALAELVHPAARLGGLGSLSEQSSTVAIVGGLQILLLAWLAYLAITALPALADARKLEAR